MDDSWRFRTTRGYATVADGELRVRCSPTRLARNYVVENAFEESEGLQLLFVVSVLGTIGFLLRVPDAVRAVLSGSAAPLQWLVLGVVAFAAVLVVREATRTRTVPLADIGRAERDGETIRVFTAGGEEAELEIEAPSEADAAEAVELLYLKGVNVVTGRGDEGAGEAEDTTTRRRRSRETQ